jgi:serine/threonine protein kinase
LYTGLSMDTAASQLRVGHDFLGKYYVLAQIGKGSGGQVFKANHKLMDRLVAIKTVVCADEEARKEHLERLKQEARAASALQHPNLVAVYDYGILADGNAYTVMDFVEGESLEEILERDKIVPYQKCIEIFMQVCDGMEHAHERGVVHRDLKPSNIMVTRTADGTMVVKVVDFGIAKLMPWAGKEGLKMTITGEIFGTPFYMSPEQCLNKSTDHRTDVYSLGCTMYEALMGASPAVSDALMSVLSKHISEPAKPFKQFRKDLDVPEELEAIVMRCLEKEPDKRWGSMSEMLRELRKLAAPEKTNGSSSPVIRVLVADDSTTDSKVMQAILSKQHDIEVVGIAVDGEDAIDQLLTTHPQVVLMDLNMPRLSGLDATKQIKQRFGSVKIIGISAERDSERVIQAFTAGIDGYCSKDGGLDTLPAAVRAVAYGGTWMDPAIASSFVRSAAQAAERQAEEKHVKTSEIPILESLDEGIFLCILGETYEEGKKMFEAETLYRAAIALIEKNKGQTDESLCTPLNKLANLYFVQDRMEQAQACYMRSLQLRYRDLNTTLPNLDVATLLDRLTKEGTLDNTKLIK